MPRHARPHCPRALSLLALAAVAACQDAAAPDARRGLAADVAVAVPAGRWTVARLLPELPGVAVEDINNAGQVSGYSSGAFRATIGDPGSRRFLPMYVGRALNDAGAVAGDRGYSELPGRLWTPDGRETELRVPPGGHANPGALNERGQVAGTLTPPRPSTEFRAVRWEADGQMTDIAPGQAYDVNEAGAVVGTTADQAFLWTPATGLQRLATPAGRTSQAYAINDAGLVVGAISADDGYWPVAWPAPDRYVRLALGGARTGIARDVNNAGMILGDLNRGVPRDVFTGPVVWPTLEHPPELLPSWDTLATPPSVIAINDRGQAVGRDFVGSVNGSVVWTFESAAPDAGTSTAPTVAGLRLDPAGPVAVGAKACGGRYTVCVRYQITDPDGATDEPFQTVVDWGDGTAWRPNSVPANTPLLAPHDYTAAGQYTVTVTVTDRRGASGTTSVPVVVIP